MGLVFGKQTVAEPAYEVLAKHSGALSYEIRKYGTRYAAEVSYMDTSGADDADRSPFSILAKYIGVFGTPENEGQQPMAMTAPVVKGKGGEPVKMAMTAPVVKERGNGGTSDEKTMAFILPEEFNSMDKIPKPTNPKVHIKELAPEVGAVYQYSGSYDDQINDQKALEFAKQLRTDGLETMTDDFVLEHYQFWGYNPPFTLPMFRRNEIWVGLSEEQAKQIVSGVDTASAN